MNILLLNWRDIKNPSGGGAEILTHEILKRLAKNGHEITHFSSSFPLAKKREIIDDITYLRMGKWYTVHIYAFSYYLRNRNTFDVIIDEVHWYPFFAALYAPNKTIALTCEVASKLFFTIFPRTIAYIFLFIEKIYLHLYRKVPTMVISKSTYDELIKTGHTKDNLIILPMGVTLPKKVSILPKEENPTIISVGRLNQQKGTLDTLDAFRIIHKGIPESTLWFVGSGDATFIEEINKRVKQFNIKKAVKLWGFVSEEEKFQLLSRAWVQISASRQEGWGLTIPEAGLMKTPSVVYNIEGFRDIIEHNQTGILVNNNPDDLAKKTLTLLQNTEKYRIMQKKVFEKSQQYSWDKTADTTERFIKNIIKYL